MQVTLSGSFDRRVIRATTNGQYVYDGSNRVGYNSSGDHYMLCTAGSGEVFDPDFRDTITSGKITLKLTAAFKAAIASDGYLQVWVYREPVYDTDPAYTYRRMTLVGSDKITVPNTTKKWYGDKVLEVEISGAAMVKNMLANGFGIFAFGLQNMYEVSAATLELTGESTEPPPEIAVDTGYMQGTYTGGIYYHPAGDTDLYAGITYSQSLGVAMEYMRYTVRDAAGAVVYTGQTTDKKFLLPKQYWREIPASGTIEMVAVSAHGIPSSAAVLPWVISHRDVRIVSPVSGSILETGEDVKISWEMVLPDGFPSSAPNPTRYTLWPAWDDDDTFTTAVSVTSRSYTIPADDFAGHTRLKLLILDEYGSVARRQGDGRLLMLYLQPSAAMTSITVSPQASDGTYAPVLTVSWTAEGQTAYQITAGDYDSGPVWGTAGTHQIPAVFDDGVVPIRIRIQDANGRWGAWSEPIFVEVKNKALSGGSAVVTAETSLRGVRLSIKGVGVQYTDVLIYRDGVLIAQLAGSSAMEYVYEDTMAAGECGYRIRFVNPSTGYYYQTGEIRADATPETDGILLDDGTWIALRYTPDFPRHYNITVREETYQRYYAGRAYPVTVRSGRKSRIVNMEYIDKGYTLCSELEAACGSVVVYKTVLGDVIRGEINQVSGRKGSIYSRVSFRLTEVDRAPAVRYRAGG
jgi:ribosomal protein L35AE/L33A